VEKESTGVNFSILTPICALMGHDFRDARITTNYIYQYCRLCDWERRLKK
jgi:hypothetical protein